MSDQSLSEFIYLSIASIIFKISSNDLQITKEQSASYQPFLVSSLEQKKKPVPVNIHIGKIPSLKSHRKIFTNDRSWEMYSDETCRYLVFYATYDEQQEPVMLAEFQPNGLEVNIYCSPDSVDETGDRQKSLPNPVTYPLDQLLLIYLLAQKAVLIHAAGAIVNKRGYLFAGASGAGKSTISKLLMQHDFVELLNDDRIILEKSEEGFLIHGTPWPGEAGIAVNKSAPLNGLFFLQHGKKNMIRKLHPRESMTRLFQVTSLPWYDEKVLQSGPLILCDEILSGLTTYEISFQPGLEIITMLEEYINV